MDPHPKFSSEAETKDATAASEVGEFSFLTCPGFIPLRTRFSEQEQAPQLVGTQLRARKALTGVYCR